MTVFNTYAQFYDLLYHDKDYARESEYVHQLIQTYVPGARTLLEFGCGTGKHACCLSQYGYSLHGIDASPEMIRSAIERCAQFPSALAANINFCQGDMRDFQFDQQFDVIIALFHVINYQVTHADLVATFANVATHLKPNGIFLFDFWYGPAVLTLKPDIRVKRAHSGNLRLTRIAEPMLLPNENCVAVEYELFVEDLSIHTVEVIREVHKMRYLFYPELESLAMIQGLTIAACSEWMTPDDLGLNSWSGMMVLKKEVPRHP